MLRLGMRELLYKLSKRGGSGSFVDVLLGMTIITTLCSAATGAFIYFASNPQLFRIP